MWEPCKQKVYTERNKSPSRLCLDDQTRWSDLKQQQCKSNLCTGTLQAHQSIFLHHRHLLPTEIHTFQLYKSTFSWLRMWRLLILCSLLRSADYVIQTASECGISVKGHHLVWLRECSLRWRWVLPMIGPCLFWTFSTILWDPSSQLVHMLKCSCAHAQV